MTNVKVSKMTIAVAIYTEVFSRGYDLKGKTQRAVFIERAIAEIPMSKHGAATYYQNISNKVNKGMSLYHYNKPAKKSTTKVVTKEVVNQAEMMVLLALPLLPKERWTVIDQNGTEVNCFKTRTEAQVFAKDNDMKWSDRNKAA